MPARRDEVERTESLLTAKEAADFLRLSAVVVSQGVGCAATARPCENRPRHSLSRERSVLWLKSRQRLSTSEL